MRRLAALALVGALAVACAGGGHGASSAATERLVDLSGGDAAHRVVERYVLAIGGGRFAAANRLACEEARVPTGSRSREDLGRLEAEMGQVTGVTTRVVAQTGVRVPHDLVRVVFVAYRVVTGSTHHDERVLVTGVRDGVRLVCGATTEQAPKLLEVADDLGGGAAVGDLELVDRLPPAPAGQELVRDEAVAPRRGDLGSWVRSWKAKPYGGTTTAVSDFSTPAGALEGARRELLRYVADAVEAVHVPEVPGAAGLRVLAFSYLAVQPPDVGPYFDAVWLQYGTLTWYLAAGGLPSGSDHDAVGRLAIAVRDRNQRVDG